MTALTRRQRQIFDFIDLHMRRHGVMPNYQLIGAIAGIRTSTIAWREVEHLLSVGWLVRDERGSIRVNHKPNDSVCPLFSQFVGTEAARLRADLQRAEDQIHQMQAALAEQVEPMISRRLTRLENAVLAFLIKKGTASKNAIHQWVYSNDPNGGPHSKTLEVVILKIRRKLPPGAKITTIHGVGWSIDEETIRILQRESSVPPAETAA